MTAEAIKTGIEHIRKDMEEERFAVANPQALREAANQASAHVSESTKFRDMTSKKPSNVRSR